MEHYDLFMRVYDEVQTYLLEEMARRYRMDRNRVAYLREMMNTTCLGGKYNRGLCVVSVADVMYSAAHADSMDDHAVQESKERVLHDACVCGWMIEMLQAHFLVEDDIMDSSKVRRGKPCWYLHPGVTTQVAINDGLIIFAWATELAYHYLADRPYLSDIVRTFHSVDMSTTIGQFYDVTSMVDSSTLNPHVAHAVTTDYVEFTLANYERIVHYKTAYYTYWLPLMMGILVSETTAQVDMASLEKIALRMGEYFQVQDDVMDCFAAPEKLGKVGTDIQDAKCSWLAITFLAHASEEQTKLFKTNYGSEEEEKVSIIKKLYQEANVLSYFDTYEQDVVADVTQYLNSERTNPALARCVEALWKKTHKREK